jgi:hypothetical protein
VRGQLKRRPRTNNDRRLQRARSYNTIGIHLELSLAYEPALLRSGSISNISRRANSMNPGSKLPNSHDASRSTSACAVPRNHQGGSGAHGRPGRLESVCAIPGARIGQLANGSGLFSKAITKDGRAGCVQGGPTHSARVVFRGVCFAGALLVAACARSHARSLMPTGRVLVPGDADLTTTHFHDASITYHVLQAGSANTPERQVAQASDTTQLTSYRGAPALLLIQGSKTRGRVFMDSALVLRDGLSPIWEIQHSGTHSIRIDYSGTRVRRSDSAPDTALRRVEHTYDVPVFHFNELNQLIRSVPLRAGYYAILPLYSEGDDALEMDTVRVEGRDSTGVWNVRFADKVIIGHYGIDGSTREMVRYEVERHVGGPHFYMKLEPSR